ncbi:MAG: universal stress protein [Bacteroidetes bacterium]|nr:universal stress protein [Bacteroidota bacterium]
MKKILVATDFSTASTNAVNYAADMAAKIYADLVVVHVATVPVNISEIPVMISDEEIKRDAENNIQELKKELEKRTAGKLNIETKVEIGSFFQSLKEICSEVKPYIVIIGTQGKSQIEKLFLGTHAAHVLQHLTWPVMAIPPKAIFSGIKKIGLACDFNSVAKSTPVNEIKRFVTDLHAELHVVNIGRKEKYNPELVFQSGQMEEMLVSLKPDYHLITGEDLDRGLLDFADMQHVDILIVLPKEHNIIEKILHKSHTKEFTKHTHVPLLALHP